MNIERNAKKEGASEAFEKSLLASRLRVRPLPGVSALAKDQPDRALEILGDLGINPDAVKTLHERSLARAEAKTKRVREFYNRPEAHSDAVAKAKRLALQLRDGASRASPGAASLLPSRRIDLSLQDLEYGQTSMDYTNPFVGQFGVSVEGHNYGLSEWWGSGADSEEKTVSSSWYFDFTPAVTGAYRFTAFISYAGHYIVYADDGWPESKEAGVDMVLQPALWGGSTVDHTLDIYDFLAFTEGRSVFKIGDDNIDAHGELRDVYIYEAVTPTLIAGHPVEIAFCAVLHAFAKGDGSVAELDFSSLPGYGVACPFAKVALAS